MQRTSPPVGGPHSEIHIYTMQPVTLEGGTGEQESFVYASMIRRYREGVEVLVDVPVHEEREVEVPTGAPLRFSTTHVDGVRTFSTRVLRRDDESEPVLVLDWPTGVVKINRRDNIRMSAQLQVDITYCTEPGGSPSLARGTTSDLSEGGMRLVVPDAIAEGTELSIRLHLPTKETHVCGGRIVFSGMQESPKGELKPWVGVQFTTLSTEIQRSLRDYLWDLQREILRRAVR